MDRPPDGSESNELALSLTPLPSASGDARAAIRKRFAGALSRATIADLELVVSELVANAVQYGRGPVRVNVRHIGEQITGSVTDEGDGFVYELHDIASNATRGRGLAIVDALVTGWGIHHSNTQVWFEMTLGPA